MNMRAAPAVAGSHALVPDAACRWMAGRCLLASRPIRVLPRQSRLRGGHCRAGREVAALGSRHREADA